MNELLVMFLLNLIASFLGALIALVINRRWKKETFKEIKKLKSSLTYYIKKYGERKDE